MSRRRLVLVGLSSLIGLAAPGCVHRRHIFHDRSQAPPADSGVRVRAPFVDVQVQGGDDVEELDDLD